EPAVAGDGDAGVAPEKRGDFMEDIRGEHDQFSGRQPPLKRAVRKLGTQRGVTRIEEGVGAIAGVKEAQYPALRVLRDPLAGAYAVDRRPGGQGVVVGDEGARVAADVKPGVIVQFEAGD